MTSAQSPSGLPLAAAAATEATESEVEAARNPDSAPTVGASDAARSGADTDLTTDTTTRDTDGVPVGSADAEADARASGADE
jgi:hypothetical protein